MARLRGGRKVPKEQTAASGGAILVTRFAVTSVLNYAFSVALVWLLPPGEYAAVSVLQNVLLLGALVLSAGFPWVLARGEISAARGSAYPTVFRAALLGNVALGASLSVALLVLQMAGLGIIPSASTWMSVSIALMLPLMGLANALGGALQGLRRFAGEGMLQTSDVLTKCLVGLAFVTLLQFGAVGVAFGFLAGSAAAVCYGWRALRDRLPGRGPIATYHTFRLALPMWVSSSCFGLLATIDVLALGLFSRLGLAVTAIASYQVAVTLGRAMYYVADAFIDAAFPFMAAEDSSTRSHDWFKAALRCIPLLILPTQLVLLVAPEPLVALMFPSSYSDVAWIVRILDVGTLGLILTAWYNKALFAQGRGVIAARWVPLGVVAELAALAVLVPRFGVLGAAIAFGVGSWGAALPLLWAYSRFHRLASPSVRTVLRHSAALFAALLPLILTWFLPHPVGLALMAVALVVHLTVARALRIVTDEDMGRLRSVVDRVVKRNASPGIPLP